jgi:hypothetical protein
MESRTRRTKLSSLQRLLDANIHAQLPAIYRPGTTPGFTTLHTTISKRPSMGSGSPTFSYSIPRTCGLAVDTIPSVAFTTGLSQTDASFGALIWCVAAGGPP